MFIVGYDGVYFFLKDGKLVNDLEKVYGVCVEVDDVNCDFVYFFLEDGIGKFVM